MSCLAFLCSSFGEADPEHVKPSVQFDKHASNHSPSPSVSQSTSISRVDLPVKSSGWSKTQTQSQRPSIDQSVNQSSVQSLQSGLEQTQLNRNMSRQLPMRRLFPTASAFSVQEQDVEVTEYETKDPSVNRFGRLMTSRPSMSTSSTASTATLTPESVTHSGNLNDIESMNLTGRSSTSQSSSPACANRASPQLPPPHPNTRRLRDAHPELAMENEQRTFLPGHLIARPQNATTHFIKPHTQPIHQVFHQPMTTFIPPPVATSEPVVPSPVLPLRARRLQRYRALSVPNSPASKFIRRTHIDSNPALKSYFQLPIARSLMCERLRTGLIATHHDAMTRKRVYRRFQCDDSFNMLLCSDLNATNPSCQLVCSAITKIVRGVSTRSLIQRSVDGGEVFIEEHLLSICTHEGSIDIECCSETERDEWFLIFDFLLYWWNEQRMALQRGGVIVPLTQTCLIGSIPGVLRQMSDLHFRTLVSNSVKQSRQESIVETCTSNPSYSFQLSDASHEMAQVYYRDIEAVREINRVTLVDGCNGMVRMQQQIDRLRAENAKIVESLQAEGFDNVQRLPMIC